MSRSYDKYLQEEGELWREAVDSETIDGLLNDVKNDDPLHLDDEDFEIYSATGIF
ncbi:MAG: hypothetical protein IJH39_05165 [Clostridia bacterium]|nr:hypothetical protein [Clostridia bacterium]